MVAMLRDSVAVVRTRRRAIPLAMITMRKSIHGFPFLSYMSMGSAWRPFGPSGLHYKGVCQLTDKFFHSCLILFNLILRITALNPAT